MAHTFSNLFIHVIFSTKDRDPVISPDLQPRLWNYLGGVLREERCHSLGIGGTADHVHMLVRQSATAAISDLMRVVKANSSKWVHENWPNKPFAWQVGYEAFTVSQSNVEEVQKYIARQEEHHRRMTFQEEFVLFLKRHGIEFDERYIWE